MLHNIRFILVETSHPGNIGAAARAMKTMGLTDLWLVAPLRYPCAEATARASGADDVLHAARVVASLDAALAGCAMAFGTSARARELGAVEYLPRAAAARAAPLAQGAKVAFVFGREQWGLTNEELDRCQGLVRIPANPDYSSLNLAAAVQLLAYELRLALCRPVSGDDPTAAEAPASVGVDELEGLYAHLERALVRIGYHDPDNPRKLMRRLRRLFGRIDLQSSELQILRGILTAAERAADGRARTQLPGTQRGE